MNRQRCGFWNRRAPGAHFYVCGDAKAMARDVESALKQICAEQGGMTLQRADQYVAKLARTQRQQRNVC